jgi:hypothetical protein
MAVEIVILLTALVGFLATMLGGFVVVWREVNGVHRILNSRLTELLELTRKSAHAAGVKEAENRPRQDLRK